jgi:hypothetical protein
VKDKNDYSLEKSKDIRLSVTSKIWAFATGMLGICIPLSAATNSGPILPIAVITGATVGTVSIWNSDRKSPNTIDTEVKFQQLERRIADLETIIASEPVDLSRRIPTKNNTEINSQILPES